jgi:hypothetical protein
VAENAFFSLLCLQFKLAIGTKAFAQMLRCGLQAILLALLCGATCCALLEQPSVATLTLDNFPVVVDGSTHVVVLFFYDDAWFPLSEFHNLAKAFAEEPSVRFATFRLDVNSNYQFMFSSILERFPFVSV